MSILIQREFTVGMADRAEFERQSRDGLWPAYLHFGSPMVAYGTWGFGGDGDVVVTHTVYTNFEHWLATRAGIGAFYHDPAMLEEIKELRKVYEQRGQIIGSSRARIVELNDAASRPRPLYRKPGEPIPEPPPTFGRGSVVSERSYALTADAHAEFMRLSRELIWPWLEQQGGRAIAVGRDPLAPSEEVITLFAFRSLPDWHRLSRPLAELQPPATVVAAWEARRHLVQRQWGRLLIVGTDWGTRS
jgi:hypothetical protein